MRVEFFMDANEYVLKMALETLSKNFPLMLEIEFNRSRSIVSIPKNGVIKSEGYSGGDILVFKGDRHATVMTSHIKRVFIVGLE